MYLNYSLKYFIMIEPKELVKKDEYSPD